MKNCLKTVSGEPFDKLRALRAVSGKKRIQETALRQDLSKSSGRVAQGKESVVGFQVSGVKKTKHRAKSMEHRA